MLNYKKYLGDYSKIYVAHSKNPKIRYNSSSGGAATSLLLFALKNKIIDAAIVVGMNKKEPWKHEIKIAETEADIISAAGSKYVLIPFSNFLNQIKKAKRKRLAVVGLPCHINILRRLQKKYKNIKLLIGLFCGYNISLKATEFLIKKSGIKKKDIVELKYRGGKYPGGFMIKTKDNKIKLFPKYYYDFINLIFVPQGCLNCKDYTNELADVSIGDAWGYENYSLVLVRTKLGEQLVTNKSLNLRPLKEQQLIKMHRHNLKHKKTGDSFIFKLIIKTLKLLGPYLPLHFLGFLAKIRRYFLKND